ncbi:MULTISPECIES: DegV family protein [Carnobacterium]|uniref:EDD domain protein, DegV family n=1 Tax=Carnobacterium alterfunditum TaxID=28230 RepID=A0A1N6H551_9LACT|nr:MULTISPECIES: DegV family protein [Carnobacterium]MBT2731367.1 DegV family protein [Carnobacterium sp. ISL-102]SIO14825.1 EDD domain protein, DegV family [Carnobacterium alterfunditum]
MNKQKIGFLVDSGSDVPLEILEKANMKVIPLKIIYKDKEYTDKVDIHAQDVYDRLDEEIPKTSLPSGEIISELLQEFKNEGYEKVIAITISSGLSGTNNMVRLMAENVKELDVFTLDTKNIGVGSGLLAVKAADYVEKELDWEVIKEKLQDDVKKSKMFFHVPTLEYLQKGGRIGLVSSILGNVLNLKPVISCNENGIYYTAAKVRGNKKSIQKAIDLATEFAGDAKKYHLAIAFGGKTAEAQLDDIRADLKKALPNFVEIFEDQVSPALGVHTGPGLIGIGIQIIED